MSEVRDDPQLHYVQSTFAAAHRRLLELIDRFRNSADFYLQTSYSEAQARKDFIDQRTVLSQLIAQARQFESQANTNPSSSDYGHRLSQALNNLRHAFPPIVQGTALTAQHPSYKYIADLADNDPDAAAALLLSSRSDSTQAMANLQSLPLDAVARIPVGLAEMGEPSKDISAYRMQLDSSANASEKALTSVRDTLKKQVEQADQIAKEHTQRMALHEGEWSSLVGKCNKDWEELKALYDEKLSLLAPTDYWTKQAKRYRTSGIWYAIAFATVLLTAIAMCAIFGITELKEAKATSVFIAILPVIVPAFAGVWVLRVLGRQLAESLAMLKDANERVTLVKTFLALMRDETAGKAVVKEEDRALILHALFRQSRVTAVDDSPPINAFEALYRYGKSHP